MHDYSPRQNVSGKIYRIRVRSNGKETLQYVGLAFWDSNSDIFKSLLRSTSAGFMGEPKGPGSIAPKQRGLTTLFMCLAMRISLIILQ